MGKMEGREVCAQVCQQPLPQSGDKPVPEVPNQQSHQHDDVNEGESDYEGSGDEVTHGANLFLLGVSVARGFPKSPLLPLISERSGFF